MNSIENVNRLAFVKGYNTPKCIAFVNAVIKLGFIESDDAFIPVSLSDVFWLG